MNENASELVQTFMAIRNARQQLADNFEREDGELKAQQEVIEQALLKICNAIGADSVKTPYGLVMRKLKQTYWCGEWDGFKKFIRDNDLLDLFERRIHQGNLKAYLAEHATDGLPPGISVNREYEINVRRPTEGNRSEH